MDEYISLLLHLSYLLFNLTPLVTQMVKNLPVMQKTQVRSLGWEDPLEKEMALQYPCLENPMDRRAWWGLQSMWSQRVRHD